MHLRELGTTGLMVSPIGLGLASLGRPGYINLGHKEDLNGNYQVEVMQSNALKVLDHAWEFGVRYFDAARSYGKAEEFLGAWLSGQPDSGVVVGSKWGYYYTADWKVDTDVHEIKEHTLERLKKQWEESSSILKPGPDLYQIHSATMESKVLENSQVLEALFALKEQGVKIGISTSGPRQADVILKAIEIKFGDGLLFDTVQATWNLLEQSAGTALEKAHEAGMGIIVKEALANGRLTRKNTDPDFEDKVYLFEFHEKQLNVSTDALAIAGALNQPWADVVLSGATTVDQLDSNLRGLTIAWDDHMEEDLGFLSEPPEKYWRTRSQLPWN